MKKNNNQPTKIELEEKVHIDMSFEEALQKLVLAPQKEIDLAIEKLKSEKSKNKSKNKK